MEVIDFSGWPYHGAAFRRYSGGQLVAAGLDGHGWADESFAPDAVLQHYPVRIENAPSPEWGYCFMHGITGYATAFGYGINPGAIGAYGANPITLGAPLKVNGKLLKLAVFHQAGSGGLTLYDVVTGKYREVSFAFSTSPAVRVAIYDQQGQSRLVTLSQLSALNVGSIPALQARVMDFYENKMLVSIEATGFCTSLASVPDNLDTAYYMSKSGGLGVTMNHVHQQGHIPLCILELTASDNDVDAVDALVRHGTALCAGTISRSSPAGITTDGLWRRYAWSLSQSSAIVDAWYGPAGAVQTLTASYSHTRKEEARQLANSATEDGNFNVTCESTQTLGGVTQKYKHEFDWSLDVMVGQPNTFVRIWRNDNLVSQQQGAIYSLPRWPVKDNNQRALWGGSEARYVTNGFYVSVTGQESFKPEIYTVTHRDNGTQTHALFGVHENGQIDTATPLSKTINTAAIHSRTGNQSISQFTDTVQIDDPRYQLPGGGSIAVMRGYVGARLRGLVNPVTGEYGDEGTAHPVSYVNFR